MRKLVIEIELENSALAGEYGATEVERIVNDAGTWYAESGVIEGEGAEKELRDINGNVVGYVTVKED